MRKLFALLVGLAAVFTAWAQTPGKIYGTVKDGNQKALESATIALCRAADSSIIKYAVANAEGQFLFDQLAAGKYLLSVSALGHENYYSAPLEIRDNQNTIDLQKIVMMPQAKAMQGVTITSRKPFIEQKIDKMVINVDASVTNAGATALDVLEKSPGVTVDKDGNISLKGKQNVLVLMDGRPTYISGADLVNYLKGLPSSAIEQIEIMTNPPARYDAAGNSGIINIKSKKIRQKGFNGTVTLHYGQGIYAKSNNSLNLNYRVGKFNLFSNFSVNRGNGFQELDIHRQFRDPATKEIEAIFEQNSRMRNKNLFTNAKLGGDYFLTKRTTLGFVASGFINPEIHTSRNTSYLQDRHGNLDSIVQASSRNDQKWKNGSINLNLRHQFDSTGREFTTDLDYITYSSTNDQRFLNQTFQPNWTPIESESLRGDLPVNVGIYTIKADYSQPIKKWDGKFEAGVKSGLVKTRNEANYFNVDGTTESVDYTKTNHFNYDESIHAAYASVNRQFRKLGVQLGLRYEHTRYEGHQFGNPTRADSNFSQSYGSLFPTAYLSYKAGENHQWGLSFGRRIDRPQYQDLNPFLFFLDKFTYMAGNPFLKPQFTRNLELSHTYKGKFTTTLNYSHTKDYQSETFEQGVELNGDKNYATIVRQGNIGSRQNAGVSVNAQLQPAKWWTSMLYSNFNYNRFKGRLNGNGENIDVEASNLLFYANNQFKFEKGWAAELSGFYRTKGVDGQIIVKPMGSVSAGISKQILKGKGTLRLAVRDIFYTQIPKGNINFENTLAYFENRRDGRVGNLSFTWRFGKPIKNDQPRRKVGGADEELKRVKMGGS